MFEIRYVTEADKSYWHDVDEELIESEFLLKVRDRRGYVICDDDMPVGVLRYNFMYDFIPFLTLLYIEEDFRRRKFGWQAMQFWESNMRALGHRMVMTSTMVSEDAQHFYRKLGYLDRGGIFFDNTPLDQPQEMIMIKVL